MDFLRRYGDLIYTPVRLSAVCHLRWVVKLGAISHQFVLFLTLISGRGEGAWNGKNKIC
jgi:hypothetical protein